VTCIDCLVVAMAMLMLGAVLTGQQTFDSWLQHMILWIGPYFCTRLMAVSASNRQLIAKTLVASGALLTPFIFFEFVTSTNLFSHLNRGHSANFANSALQLRSGGHRVSSSFTQPIALAMFLAVAVMLGIALAVEATSPSSRRRWILATLLCALGGLCTISRTGWLMLAVAGLAACVMLPTARARKYCAAVMVVVALVAVLLGQFGPASIADGVPIVGQATAQTASSSQYRTQLVTVAFRDHLLHPFGSPINTFANAIFANYASIDNEYLNLSDEFGYIPGIALVLLLPLFVVLLLVRPVEDYLSIAFLISGLALLVAITTVAFITQQQVFVWLILGTCSAIVGESGHTLLMPRRRRRADSGDELAEARSEVVLV
jgi:hypothetical protein